jgi:hypothetical protein
MSDIAAAVGALTSGSSPVASASMASLPKAEAIEAFNSALVESQQQVQNLAVEAPLSLEQLQQVQDNLQVLGSEMQQAQEAFLSMQQLQQELQKQFESLRSV